MKYVKCTLRGGTRDGEIVSVPWWQAIHYAPRRITVAESKTLRIDDAVAWKNPDDVYGRTSADEFTYSYTVNYKPTEEKTE